MKYRLLVLDLDGTLLNSRKEVTPAVKRALEWVRNRGVHVVLSTGRIVGEIRKNKLNVTKVYAIGEREVLERALAEIRPLPGITITSSGADNFEILPAGADKGRALTRLGEMLGVTPAEMAAIGDSDNDAEMLRAVGMPVAMGNAAPALKALAKYVTADCDHDGVAQAVYHLFQ